MIGETAAVLWCVFAGTAFVASLYVWRGDRGRNPDEDPRVVRHRLISVCAATVVLLVLLRVLVAHYDLAPEGFLAFIGVRPGAGLLRACAATAALTCVLFLGPIAMSLASGYLLLDTNNSSNNEGNNEGSNKRTGTGFAVVSYLSAEYRAALPRLVRERVRSTEFWRAIVAGPVTEELVYRACMCPVLRAAGFGTAFCCALPPLCFGLAHVHHLRKHLRTMRPAEAVLTTLLQLAYTTAFGAFSCFVYLRTGHLAACVLTHMLCNHFGFPDVETLLEHEHRTPLLVAFVAGVVLFFVLLGPLTSPLLYPASSMW